MPILRKILLVASLGLATSAAHAQVFNSQPAPPLHNAPQQPPMPPNQAQDAVANTTAPQQQEGMPRQGMPPTQAQIQAAQQQPQQQQQAQQQAADAAQPSATVPATAPAVTRAPPQGVNSAGTGGSAASASGGTASVIVPAGAPDLDVRPRSAKREAQAKKQAARDQARRGSLND